jgi:HD-GYP domain-containing protein (c-di-GMP phosphodiesterase class II)
MLNRLKAIAPYASVILSFIVVAVVTQSFPRVPHLTDLYIVPIMLAGYFLSTALAVAVSLVSAVIVIATGEDITAANVIGYGINAATFILVGFLSGSISSILKAQRANISIQKNQLLSLHRVSSNFLNTLEPVAVIDQLTREARRLLAADSSMMVSFEDDRAYLLAEENLNPDTVAVVLGKLASTLRKVGASADPVFLKGDEVSQDFPFASLVIAALPNQRYLCLLSATPRVFTKDEMALLSGFLDEAVIALNGASFYEAKEKNARVISALAALNRAAAAMKDASELSAIALEKAAEVGKADAAFLLLFSKGELALAGTTGMDDDPRLRLEGILGRLSGSPEVQQLRSLREPLLFTLSKTEPASGSEAVAYAFTKALGSQMLVALPLVIKDHVSGFLCLAYRAPKRIPADDLSMLTSIASETSLVLYNAKLLSDIKNLTLKTVESLATALDSTSAYTRNHSRRVASLAVKMAQELKLSQREIREIQFAALLHDFGRIFLPDEIINSPRRLTPEELEKVRKLPIMSSKIFEPVSFFQAILPLLLHHKEHYDGTGYPSGLKGNQIPLGARIIGLAEAWVAMMSDRPFRSAMTEEEAVAEILRNSGTQFDPALVNVLLKVLGVRVPAQAQQEATHIRLVNPHGSA